MDDSIKKKPGPYYGIGISCKDAEKAMEQIAYALKRNSITSPLPCVLHGGEGIIREKHPKIGAIDGWDLIKEEVEHEIIKTTNGIVYEGKSWLHGDKIYTCACCGVTCEDPRPEKEIPPKPKGKDSICDKCYKIIEVCNALGYVPEKYGGDIEPIEVRPRRRAVPIL